MPAIKINAHISAPHTHTYVLHQKAEIYNTEAHVRVEVEAEEVLLVLLGFIILCVIVLITSISRLCYLSITLSGNN